MAGRGNNKSFVALAAVCLRLAAQTPDTAIIHGRIVDQSRAGIAAAEVSVRHALTGVSRSLRPDAGGVFTVAGLTVAGEYEITASKPGFAEAKLSGLALRCGTTAEIQLQPNVAGGQTEVVVTGVVGEVRADAPLLGDRLGARLLNPYSEQWTFGLERRLKPGWVLKVDYVGSHTLRINRPLDVNPPAPFVRTAPGLVRSAQAANCTRPYWIQWYAGHGLACNLAAATNPQPPYGVIQSDVNNGYAYDDALDVNLSHRFSRRFSLLASYAWSHTIDNVDPDVPGQNPNDPNFTARVENANTIFDQRHRFVLSGVYAAPWKINFGGVSTLATGLPFDYVTGANNSGDTGATADRPVIDGVVVGRNAGRGGAIYEVSPLVERTIALGGDRARVELRAEAFNVFNHANFVGFSGTYGNGAAPGPGFGQPLTGITNQLAARSLQFSVKLAF